jgi:hypothetical protein
VIKELASVEAEAVEHAENKAYKPYCQFKQQIRGLT